MTDVELRAYQQAAVDAWVSSDRHGILQMATGTGKTYTAIGGLDQLLEQHGDPLLTVIAVPYTHLAEQWAESLDEFNLDCTRLYGSYTRDWKEQLSRRLSDLDIGITDREIIITTHQTLSHESFITQLEELGVASCLIADEVHGLGSPHQRTALLDSHEFRLGLSATPRRQYGDGTEVLMEYFGDVVFEFTLDDAIPEYLVEYEYYPIIVEMSEEELEDYRSLSQRIAAEASKEEEDQDEELLRRLRINRAQIIKSAERKYAALLEVLGELDSVDHLLVYTNHEQIDTVQEMLNERGIRQHKFTAKEDDAERSDILSRFADGRLDALVAMKCLDEGVDVPSTRQAVLMSNSGNPKQFIQRRGRVLRHAPGKDGAVIYDMLVVPSVNPDRTLITSEQGIIARELQRFDEFAATAVNETQAKSTIQPIKTQYEIHAEE